MDPHSRSSSKYHCGSGLALNINGDSDQDPDMDPNQTIKYGNRAVDPDPHGSGATWIRIHWPFLIRIHIQNADPDPGGKN